MWCEYSWAQTCIIIPEIPAPLKQDCVTIKWRTEGPPEKVPRDELAHVAPQTTLNIDFSHLQGPQ